MCTTAPATSSLPQPLAPLSLLHAARAFQRQGLFLCEAVPSYPTPRPQNVSPRPRAVPSLTSRSTSLQGSLPKHPFSRALHSPALAHQGLQQQYVSPAPVQPTLTLHRTPSDLYVTCQLWADGKQYSLPFRTAHKDFPRGYTYVQMHFPTSI